MDRVVSRLGGRFMLRRALLTGAVLAGALAGLAPARGDEDMRIADKFLQGLRDHQLYDLASEYLEQLRTEPETPADLRSTIDYEQGRIMLEEASKSGDLVRRKELLDQARGKIATFVDKNAKHPTVPEASVELARLLVERGHLAMLTAGELDDKEKAEKKPISSKRKPPSIRPAPPTTWRRNCWRPGSRRSPSSFRRETLGKRNATRLTWTGWTPSFRRP